MAKRKVTYKGISAAELEPIIDNTYEGSDPMKLGILRFGKDYFPDVFTDKYAPHHISICRNFLELYNPLRENKLERQTYTIIHREAAKTTIDTFLIPNYLIWLKGHKMVCKYRTPGWEGSDLHNYDLVAVDIGERFIVIASETASSSERFVINIKVNLETRVDMMQKFGDKRPQKIIVEDEELEGDTIWRKSAFITSDNTAIVGIGSGQQVRGMNIRNSRPTLVVVDDMYSKNNIKTPERREELNKWFEAELSNSIDSKRGKFMFLGTIPHEDTVPVRIMADPQWFGFTRPIISYEELRKVLDEHCTFTDDGKVLIPSKEKCKEIQKSLTSLSWPDRHNLYYILGIYQRDYNQGKTWYFYQEYLNIVHSPDEIKFDKTKFKFVEFTFIEYLGQNFISVVYDGLMWIGLPEIVGAVDLASADNARADETAIAIGGIIRFKAQVPGTNDVREMTVPVLVHMEADRGFGTYDEQMPGMQRVRKGIVTRMEKLTKMYPLQRWHMEANQSQMLVVREAKRYFTKEGYTTPIREFYSTVEKKHDRITSQLEPIFNRYPMIFVNKGQNHMVEKLYAQLLSLGDKGHDDIADVVGVVFGNAKVNPLDFNFHGYFPTAGKSTYLPPTRGGSKALPSWEVV